MWSSAGTRWVKISIHQCIAIHFFPNSISIQKILLRIYAEVKVPRIGFYFGFIFGSVYFYVGLQSWTSPRERDTNSDLTIIVLSWPLKHGRVVTRQLSSSLKKKVSVCWTLAAAASVRCSSVVVDVVPCPWWQHNSHVSKQSVNRWCAVVTQSCAFTCKLSSPLITHTLNHHSNMYLVMTLFQT